MPTGAASADSKDMRTNQEWLYAPREPVTYMFFCRYHECMMDATIIVEADGSP